MQAVLSARMVEILCFKERGQTDTEIGADLLFIYVDWCPLKLARI